MTKRRIDKSAIEAIDSVIGSGFKLVHKNVIPTVFSCHGSDDLYAYCAISKPNEKWSENYQRQIKNSLEQREKNSKSDFLIDYNCSVWLLIKYE